MRRYDNDMDNGDCLHISFFSLSETYSQVSRDGRYLVCEEGGGKHKLSEHDLGSLIELGY